VVINLDYLEATPNIAREAGRNTGEIKAAKTISESISFWALVEQIRTRKGFKNGNESLYFCVYNTAKDLGIES